MSDDLTFTDSIVIGRSPVAVYDLVCDVTRTGEWSPICRECWWDEDAGPQPGSWFTGRNETPDRVWETRSLVETADPGREFSWLVAGGLVRWAYSMRPVDGGTELTESWHFLPKGIQYFHTRYGDDADRQIRNRTDAARTGIPVTLAAIKRIAEETGSSAPAPPAPGAAGA